MNEKNERMKVSELDGTTIMKVKMFWKRNCSHGPLQHFDDEME